MRAGALATIISLALPLALTSGASAQEDEGAVAGMQVADADNAATWYRLAWEKHQAVEFDEKKWELIWAFEQDPDRPLSAEGRNYFRKYRPALDMLRRATRREHCDFGRPAGDDRSNADVMRPMRGLAKLERDDYLLRVADGDVDGAVECVGQVFRIANHSAQGNSVIASLVGSAMVSFANTLVTHALDRALLGPNEAKRLLREVDRLKGADPMSYLTAIDGDRETSFEPGLREYAGQSGLECFKEERRAYYKQQGQPERLAAIEKVTVADLERLFDDVRRVHQRTVEAMHEPDPAKAQAALAAIDKEVKEGAFGPFASDFVGWGAATYKNMLLTRKQLDDLHTTLKGIADGTIDPMSLANAAALYIRAALAWDQLDAGTRGVIDAYATRHEQPADDPVRDALSREDVKKLITMLQTATSVDHCEFKNFGVYWTDIFTSYNVGVLGCARLLLVMAARSLHDRSPEDAAANLAMMFRLSSHLAGDGHLGGSLAAHRIFDDAESLCAPAMNDHRFNSGQVALMAKRVREFARDDPFHYQPLIASLREGIKPLTEYYLEGLPTMASRTTAPEIAERAARMIESCSDDRIATFVLMCEAESAQRNGMTQIDLQPRDGLQSIFDLQAMQDAIDKAHLLADWGKQGVLDGLASADLPMIAPVTRREKEADESFRACLQRFDRALPPENAASKPRE